MESAFGVDHGEIEKAFGFAGLGAAMGRKTAQVGQGLRRSGASNMGMGRQMGGGFGQGMQRGGAARVKMGGQLRKLGQGMQNRPGLTGGIAAGGAAAGAGGAAGAFGNRRKY